MYIQKFPLSLSLLFILLHETLYSVEEQFFAGNACLHFVFFLYSKKTSIQHTENAWLILADFMTYQAFSSLFGVFYIENSPFESARFYLVGGLLTWQGAGEYLTLGVCLLVLKMVILI